MFVIPGGAQTVEGALIQGGKVMNTEKKVINMINEEMLEKVTGGVNEQEDNPAVTIMAPDAPIDMSTHLDVGRTRIIQQYE